MNCTGLHTDFHATLEQSKQATARIARIATESQAECERMQEQNATLRKSLAQAIRYIEVQHAYRGAMTKAEIEAKIIDDRDTLAEVQIACNSCTTLAKFDFRAARNALKG